MPPRAAVADPSSIAACSPETSSRSRDRNLDHTNVLERPMSRWQRFVTTAAAAAVCVVLPGQALASNTETSMLQDADQIIYSTPQHEVAVLKYLHSLGV